MDEWTEETGRRLVLAYEKVVAERDRLRTELAAEIELHGITQREAHAQLGNIRAERDRLRRALGAVMLSTEPATLAHRYARDALDVSPNMGDDDHMARERSFLGQQVKVTIARGGEDPAVVVTGRLLRIADSGEFVTQDDMGFIGYSWPLLDIERADPDDDLPDASHGTIL
jgi:hypothetical protein